MKCVTPSPRIARKASRRMRSSKGPKSLAGSVLSARKNAYRKGHACKRG